MMEKVETRDKERWTKKGEEGKKVGGKKAGG